MSHDHHHHELDLRSKESRKAAVVGAIVNLILAIVKITLGYVGKSHALLVDGIHSLSDLVSDAIVWYAATHAAEAPDKDHPYGHGRFETAATLALGAMLVLVAGGIIWDSVERLIADDTDQWLPTTIGLYAALFSIIANEALYWYTILIAKKINSSLLKANAWHHRSDAISSIVVLVGIGGSLLGFPWFDTVAAVIVGVMIAKIGWDLGWGSMQELVDSSLEEETVIEINHLIKAISGVQSVHMLRTRRLGHQAFADVHVQVAPRLSVSEGHLISVQVEEKIKSFVPEVVDVTVHIDPENDEDAPSCKDLPGRESALDVLAIQWKSVLPQLRHYEIVLHYLAGKIDIDIYLPQSEENDLNDFEKTKEELQAIINKQSNYGKVRLFKAF